MDLRRAMLRWAVCFLAAVGLVSCGYCPEGEPANPQDMRAKGQEVSIFTELTVEEMNGVLTYMYQRSGMRIADWATGTINDSYIYLIEALPPRKSEALAYLDSGGPKPARYAKVILFRGDASPPDIQEIRVGPLPYPNEHEVIKNPHYKDPIPYHNRNPVADHELRMWDSFMKQELGKIDDLLKTATDGYSFKDDCGSKCLTWFPNTPGQWQSGSHTMWVNFYKKLDGYYLHPVGLQIRVDANSFDISKWFMDYIWWRGEEYRSIEDIVQAVEDGEARDEAIPDFENANDHTIYSSLNFRGEPRPKKSQRGPMSYYPDGRRFSVEGRRVKWQGWEFEVTMPSVSGLHIYDASFLGERITYEMGVVELGAFYSGKTPLPMHTSFFDTIVLLGRESYSLTPGLDCPEHATFLDTVHYLQGKPFVFKNSICVFEHNMGIPIRRHYETNHKGGYEWVQGMPDNALIVRSFIVAYNYEYLIDYIFHQHGGMDGKCTLTGYVLSTFFDGDREDSQGFKVFPNGQANIHQHLVNFKVDMDIKGTENRFETLDVQQTLFEDPVDVGKHMWGNEFVHNLRSFEEDAKIKPEVGQHLLIYNSKKENKYGNKNAYRIQIPGGTSTMYGEKWELGKAGAWSMQPLTVTKRKEEEQSSTSIYASVDPFDPVMSFYDFTKDNDNIVDQDLVLWLTLGTLHIPHSEDIPIVITQNTQLVFHLSPYNYFDEDQSLSSRDNIRVEPNENDDGDDWVEEGEEPHFMYSGVKSYVDCVPQESLAGGTGSGNNLLGSMVAIVTAFVVSIIFR